ncbi:hypothetical protein AKO1_008133 [Acrasis kona]|uniref:Uncharacterized protein n=1 Tax=Acrasis kona TaxID=1008807 RepID=A0AAW2YNM1_9EUKA
MSDHKHTDRDIFNAFFFARAHLLLKGVKNPGNDLVAAFAAKKLGDESVGSCLKEDLSSDPSGAELTEISNCLKKKKSFLPFLTTSRTVNRLEQAQLFPELSVIAKQKKDNLLKKDSVQVVDQKLKGAANDCEKYKKDAKYVDYHYCVIAHLTPDSYRACDENVKASNFGECLLSKQPYKDVESKLPPFAQFMTRITSNNPTAEK